MDENVEKRFEAEIQRGHSQLEAIYERLEKINEKIESLVREVITNISDTNHLKELFDTKLIDLKEEIADKIGKIEYDVNNLGNKLRAFKTWIYVLIIGLLVSLIVNVIMFALNKGG